MDSTRHVISASFVLRIYLKLRLRSHPQQLSGELVCAPGLADGEGAQGLHYPAYKLLLLCGCKYDFLMQIPWQHLHNITTLKSHDATFTDDLLQITVLDFMEG